MDASATDGPALPEIVRAQKLEGRVTATYAALSDGFQSSATDSLPLTFEGVPGDFHAGFTRRSGGREPWYPRGTEIRNERQVSIVDGDELSEIARRMEIAAIRPEWIGANLVLEGIPRLSMLPSGTLMFFEGGVTLKVDGQNGPCRLSGRAVAKNSGMDDINSGTLRFPAAARRLRGIVAWVEKPGMVVPGEAISVRIPEQWIYRV